ncbi:hypothetical protein [Streptomyces sp. NPDC001914]|uniref:hypothetical protein n=1 Tax=Streptomyces sp. NPDC001914 TaxID=3364623 RepID=UPI0036ACEF67
MQSSIAQATAATTVLGREMRDRTPAEAERDDLRDLLTVIRDALDLPADHRREALLSARVMLISGTLRDVLDGSPLMGISWETDLLRRLIEEAGGPHA